MARLVLGAAIGTVIGMLIGAALSIRAEQLPTDETIAVADEAGVDAFDLQGAVNTTLLEPRAYLIAVGELAAPNIALPQVVNTGWPILGALGQRIYCVEAIESGHGRWMWNPQGWPPPFYNEHAQGLSWLAAVNGAAVGRRHWRQGQRMGRRAADDPRRRGWAVFRDPDGEMLMTIEHLPNGVSHGSRYTLLSPTVLRLDRTLGPHVHHQRVLPWRWFFLMVFVAVMFWAGVGAVVWTIWRHVHA